MFLITGATGQQGGATIKHLRDHKVRALVRNSNSEASKKLAAQGVELATGDLTNSDSIYDALEGCDGAFLVTTMIPNGPQDEIVQGKAFLEAAKRRNINHIVYTSVDGAERNSGVPHFESKGEVERLIAASGLKHTIVRPVAFMDNFPKRSGIMSFLTLGLFSAAIYDKKVQLISAYDIGRVSATALKDPARYAGRVIPLASEALTVSEMQNAYKEAHGSLAWKAYLPGFTISFLSSDFSKMFYWFRNHGYKADIPSLRQEFPGMLTFSQWLKSKD
ncbi:hypothetical protein E3P99_03369 [Wallemia hederae]|uniref:NmrA-like domain-containing protein n=1 Tax=Wallemia hederae TaxID=1540922 RepID=A0A4V4LSW4_9BASI|nr:hypothetical protein E3P99_03369 [Wallemia hederae]